ncbi:HesA/MoeB/ThiF family protein [Epibacterium sp. SM1969]|uniref:HesA/MoeB/ThiF family protein n=1 Tax=Tritonibacter aquimaris TaxID=2663379 RepID=A0A844AWJ5_9RHOB|nr:HesA/MoeB/ThiF family protein [Tritonibacter aquimaris]MQY44257.1 HesA/MoeB/ThiF family protein [Tritonibacter aquimaris]
MSRYARQIAVPEFGPEGQAKLARARLLVIGAGGLAAPLLPYLAGAGVGEIHIIDPDTVELSNLHRQTLFRESDVGAPKAEAAAKHLRTLNADCTIVAHVGAFDPASAENLCEGMDLVLDCADSFAASYISSDMCQKMHLPLISASVVGMDGYVGGFCAGAPSLRALFPDLPRAAGTCATLGVLGPVVGVIATLQAQMAIAILQGQAPSPLGQLVTFDARDFRFGGFRFDGAPEPEHRPAFIDASQIRTNDLVIDLRTPDEGPLPREDALRLSVDDLNQTQPPAQPGQRILLCCRSGLRAWAAAELLAPHHAGPIAMIALGDQSQTSET